jgi:amino acid adenylation domain-containing protein
MTNVLQMLEETAERYPDKIAFADPSKEISFGELEKKARKVGSYLISENSGIALKMGEAVAFYMEKSVDAATVMFGAVYGGGFYSFIDVRQPAERAAGVISVLEPAVIVTDDENAQAMEEIARLLEGRLKVISISELLEKAEAKESDEEALKRIRKEFCDTMPLYVNFTSGSTGTPKGVAVGHASVIDFITEFTGVFGITCDDVIANQAPFDFDVSVKDVYSGLYTGARVQLIPREYFTQPTTLMDYLADNKTTTLIWAVSAMCFVTIMNALEYRVPDRIRMIMFSGEIMPVKQLNKWRKFLPDATYVNLYGPTEITCNCTYHILDREYEKDEMIPAGIPFANEKVFLLDEDDRLVTGVGEEGEICVGGTCLAIGYYRDSEKTDQAFVQNPLNDRYHERIYRTGDLGKYDEEGRLIYTSRKDFQIKHMGQRIELGEIEVASMSVAGVSRACCLYDHKKKKILLYYTGEAEKESVTEALQQKLPQYMVPGKTTRLDEMPMNKNGKIDRGRLGEGKDDNAG